MNYYKAENYRAQDSIGYLIKRTGTLMHDRIERDLESSELSFMQWALLIWVRDGIARTASDFCRAFKHDSGALTRMIDALEERKLLQRTRSKLDRRVIELSLTPAGERAVGRIVPQIVTRLNEALDGFSRSEAEQLKQLLGRLLDNLLRMDLESQARSA